MSDIIKQKVSVLGAGSWGSVLAHVLSENGHDVLLWTLEEEHAKEMNTYHTNERYLTDEKLSKTIIATTDLEKIVHASEIILFVIPTSGIRELAQKVNALIDTPKLIIHASKGLEQKTYKRISEVLAEEIDEENREAIVVLSGPSHAEEVIRKDITSVTAASKSEKAAIRVQNMFMNDYFRIYTNSDVVGVELGGALKNIIALGSGIASGLGFGDNAKAALITRGLAEISRFGKAFGADPQTFSGLSGVGDLIVTGMSTHSRNYQAGYLIGQGMSADKAVEEIGMVVEGFYTTMAAYELAKKHGIDMPITEGIYRVINDELSAKDALDQLMLRSGKSEESSY